MQLGISSYTYGWNIGVPEHMPDKKITEVELIQKANDFGVKVLQLGDNLPLHTFDDNRLKAFEALLNEDNIQLEIGARGLTIPWLKKYVSLAARMHAGILRFVIDADDYKPSLREIVQTIQLFKPELEKNNVVLALENHDRLKASAFAEIIREVNSTHVGICLDTANSLGAGESIDTIVEVLAPYTVNLHLKDFGIERLPHKQGFIIDGRIAGEGMLNIPYVLQKIRSYNKCKTAILEQWVQPEKDIQKTLSKEIDWAAKSMTYLRSVQG